MHSYAAFVRFMCHIKTVISYLIFFETSVNNRRETHIHTPMSARIKWPSHDGEGGGHKGNSNQPPISTPILFLRVQTQNFVSNQSLIQTPMDEGLLFLSPHLLDVGDSQPIPHPPGRPTARFPRRRGVFRPGARSRFHLLPVALKGNG
jgi:hypothetical protein